MNSRIDESVVIRAIVDLNDYRAFLKTVLNLSSKDGRCNYAAFSRKAGFTSRSFLTQVLHGDRRLTSKSFPKIECALPLSPKLKTFFQLLVAREEPEVNFDGLSLHEINNRLNSLRNKFKLEIDGLGNKGATLDSVFMGRELLECYAALGPKEVGASLSEIQNRTGLPPEICSRVLKHFVTNHVVTVKDGRYFAENPHLIFYEGASQHQGFRECYLQTLNELKRKAQAQFKSDERAFFQSIFSVERQHLPKLKKRLWDVVNEFVEANEAESGDSVGKLLVGFYT